MRARGWTTALVLIAVLVRIAAVLVLRSHTVPRSTFEHGEIAANLLAGKGFSVKFLGAEGPTSQQAPIYPVLVAGAYAIGGVGTPRALLLLQIGQALMGGALVAVVIGLGRVVAPERPRIALIAGAIAALHPTLVYAATHVQVASLATLLLASTFLFAHRAKAKDDRRGPLLCGFLLGLTALTDPILGLAAPGLMGMMGRKRLASSGLIALAAALMMVTCNVAREKTVRKDLTWYRTSMPGASTGPQARRDSA